MRLATKKINHKNFIKLAKIFLLYLAFFPKIILIVFYKIRMEQDVKKIFTFVFIFPILLNSLELAIDTNKDGKPDRWITITLYKEWEKFDFNKNGKADEECFYIDETKKVFLIEKEMFEYSQDGKIFKGTPNVWINYEIKDEDFYSTMEADLDFDGKKELVIIKKNNRMILKKSDNNRDGKYDLLEEFDEKGKKKVSEDTNNDGKFDGFYYYEEDKLILEEIDSNYDGKIDMWVIFEYNTDGSIKQCIIKKDNNHDGKPDEFHYTDDKRRVIKIEKDTDFDGKIDNIKEFK